MRPGASVTAAVKRYAFDLHAGEIDSDELFRLKCRFHWRSLFFSSAVALVHFLPELTFRLSAKNVRALCSRDSDESKARLLSVPQELDFRRSCTCQTFRF